MHVEKNYFRTTILELARKSAQSGEPIIAPLDYYFPHQCFENIKDEFLLGEQILVAPIDKKTTSRSVILPKGKWLSDDGKIY